VCRYSWHSAGSLGWPFPMLSTNIFFQIKYTEAILSNSTRKLLWFEISKMLTAVLKIKFIVLFIIIFGTFSFPIPSIVYASLCYVSLLRLVYSTRTEQVDPVTRRDHWSRASTSQLYYALIGGSETGTVSARLVLNTRIPVPARKLEYANWSSVQFMCCERTLCRQITLSEARH